MLNKSSPELRRKEAQLPRYGSAAQIITGIEEPGQRLDHEMPGICDIRPNGANAQCSSML
jgi:hypothetical protein